MDNVLLNIPISNLQPAAYYITWVLLIDPLLNFVYTITVYSSGLK